MNNALLLHIKLESLSRFNFGALNPLPKVIRFRDTSNVTIIELVIHVS